MKYLICLPVIDEATTDRCIASMPQEMLEHTLIVDNSAKGFAAKYDIRKYIQPRENIGVPKSWNIGLSEMTNRNLDYCVIMSATVVFDSHDAARGYINQLGNYYSDFGMETQLGWHLIAIGADTVEKIGYFDENFYPAYFEDSDYIRRMELSNIHLPMSKIQRLPWVKVGATDQGNAHAMKSGIKVNMDACRDYFIEKWGVEPHYDSQEDRDNMFSNPFNDPNKPLDYWEPATVEELKERYHV